MTRTKEIQLLSRAEAAKLLGISLFTIDKYRRCGVLVPHVDKEGKVLAYVKDEVEQFKARQGAAEVIRSKPGRKIVTPWIRPWRKKGASV
jgi:predicted DNA-binding transcriptional regulator AlpA